MDLKENNIVITSNLFRPHFGGVENSLYHLSKAYLEMGYRPIIVVSNLPVNDEELFRVESLDGIKVFRYEMNKGGKWLGIQWPKSLFGIISAIQTYRWIKRNFQPQLTITRYHFNQVFAWLAGLKNTVYLVPGIVKFQNAAQHIDKNGLRAKLQWYYHRALQFLALRGAGQVAVFSQNMKNQLQDIGYDKPVILTKPGVDGDRFRATHYRSNEKVILCVGRCVRAKGFDFAIKSLSQCSTGVKLWIVGDGPLLEDYKRLADELGVSHNVVFWGAQSQPESFYKKADYFLMSSIYEPLGQTILEAIASGLPVIAFRPSNDVITATEDVLGKEGACYVESLSEHALGTVIDDCVTWSDERYATVSKANRQLAEVRYSWTALADDLLKSRTSC